MPSPFSNVQLFVTSQTIAHRLLCSWDSPSKNTEVGCHALLQIRNFTYIYIHIILYYQFISVTQSCLTLYDFMNPARQASLSITNSRSLPKLMSTESVMQSSHLIFHSPLLLLPPIPPSIRVFSNESTLHMR